jgi:hypothetical protein
MKSLNLNLRTKAMDKPKIRFVLGERQLFKLSQDNKVVFRIGEQDYSIEVPPWIHLEMFVIHPGNKEPIRLTESELEHLDLNGVPESDRKKMN